MSTSCYSCGMPLTAEKAKGNFCEYCADEAGNLFPKEQIKQGIAQWLSGWAPEKENVDFLKRAENYMKAMPAWTE